MVQRMDRLRPTPNHAHPHQVNRERNTPRVRQKASNRRPNSGQTTNPSLKTGRTPRHPERRLPTNRIPTTRPSVQRRKGPTLPGAKDLGPRHRTQKGRPPDATRKDLCPHPRRKEGPQEIRRRTPQKGIHSALEEPLHRPLLLHQKERRQTPTSTRLPTPQ